MNFTSRIEMLRRLRFFVLKRRLSFLLSKLLPRLSNSLSDSTALFLRVNPSDSSFQSLPR
jgi:hypothetical protein